MNKPMYEGEIESRPTRRLKPHKGVKLDFSSEEALQKSAKRFFESLGPEKLERQVMVVMIYYYVPGITEEGRKVFYGPFTNLYDADAELAKLDDGEIFESKSKNFDTATREWKAELIRRGEKPDNALQRLSHKILPSIRKKK